MRKNNRFILANSADLTFGNKSTFQVNIPYGIYVKNIILKSVILPNTVTSPTTPDHLLLRLSGIERIGLSTDNQTFNFTVPFVPSQVTLFREDHYHQEIQLKGSGIFLQSFKIELIDSSGSPVAFSSGDWQCLFEINTQSV